MERLVLALTICGYYLFYYLNWKKYSFFFPILFVSFVSTLLFFFGLVELLPFGVFFINGLGILLGIISVFFHKQKRINWDYKITVLPYIVFFVVGVIWVFCITRNVGLSHWDDFSHWYRICKMLYSENAFPSKPDLIFRSYPPGTAVFIYYITKNITFTENNCLFAQAIINLSCCLTFFSSFRQYHYYKRSTYLISFVMISAISVFLCSINISTYSLLVDTTMPLMALATLFTVVVFTEKPKRGSFIFLVLEICFLCLIKITAIIFSLAIIVLWVILEKRKNKDWTFLIKTVVIFFLCSILPVVLYNLHMRESYGNTSYSFQNMSILWNAESFQNRSTTDMINITRKLATEIFLFSKSIPQVKIIWISLFSSIGIGLICRIKEYRVIANGFIRVTIYQFAFFMLYVFCLLMTYICSMNEQEANITTLACFYRYIGSAAIFIVGILLYYCISIIHLMKPNYLTEMFSLFTILIIITSSGMFHNGYVWGNEFYRPEEPYDTIAWNLSKTCIPENMEYTDSSYVVVYDEDSVGGYSSKIRVMMESYLRSNQIMLCTVNELMNNDLNTSIYEQMQICDYLVMLGDYVEAFSLINRYIRTDHVSDCMLYAIIH